MTSRNLEGMGKYMAYSLVIALLAVGLTGCSGCGTKIKGGEQEPEVQIDLPTPPDDGRTVGDGGDESPVPVKRPSDSLRVQTPPPGTLLPVYFDYDKAELRPDAIATLTNSVKWLRDNPDVIIQIEGHCDERGTEEYNFNLGEERAKIVIAYLLKQGIASDRLYFISYGESRPAVEGTGEAVWAQNRRAEFKLLVTESV